MAFDQEVSQQRTPTAIKNIRIVLFESTDPEELPPDAQNNQTADFEFAVVDQNGQVMNWKRGNLIPHLTAGQITQLQDFIAAMRTKAEDEILP